MLETFKIIENKLEKYSWGILAGAACYLYGSSREPTDIDILIRDEDLVEISSILNQKAITETDNDGSFTKIRLTGIELVCRLCIKKSDRLMFFKLDEEMISHRRYMKFQKLILPVLSVEDVIILKVILQRGKEYGKFDLEDIISIFLPAKVIEVV